MLRNHDSRHASPIGPVSGTTPQGPGKEDGADDTPMAPMIPARDGEAFEVLSGRADAGVLVLCDHASNHVPPDLHDLGLPPADLRRHIAWDPGAAGVARHLARLLGAPAVLSRFSRLLADPNRGLDDPTLVMRIADGSVIPGNAELDETGRRERIRRFWRPYDEAISETIEAMRHAGRAPLLLSIHTFTPVWRGVPRPWHAGLLFDPACPSISPRMTAALRARLPDATIGANEPYSGGLPGDTLDRHGVRKGLEHTLVEIRHDLLADDEAQRAWAEHLAHALQEVLDEAVVAAPNSAPKETRRES